MPPWKGRTDDGFYRLSDPCSDPPFRGRFGARSERAWAFTWAEERPDAPVMVEWAMGGADPTDIVWTTLVAPFVVAPRVLRLLERGGFTGWDSYPVDLFDKREQQVTGYVGLGITGRCDPVDWSRSELVLREFPGGWFPAFRGLFFPPGSWDGADLFMEGRGGTGGWYASARLVRALRRERIRNLHLEHCSECETSVGFKTLRNPDHLPPDFEARLTEAYTRLGVPRPASI